MTITIDDPYNQTPVFVSQAGGFIARRYAESVPKGHALAGMLEYSGTYRPGEAMPIPDKAWLETVLELSLAPNGSPAAAGEGRLHLWSIDDLLPFELHNAVHYTIVSWWCNDIDDPGRARVTPAMVNSMIEALRTTRSRQDPEASLEAWLTILRHRGVPTNDLLIRLKELACAAEISDFALTRESARSEAAMKWWYTLGPYARSVITSTHLAAFDVAFPGDDRAAALFLAEVIDAEGRTLTALDLGKLLEQLGVK